MKTEPLSDATVAADYARYQERHAQGTSITFIASDCELDNNDSEAFHKAIGFTEANRTIHFIKKLD